MTDEIDTALRQHLSERRPDHCDWSKRRLRPSEFTYTGIDRKGRWRTVAADHAGVLVKIHAVGIYDPPAAMTEDLLHQRAGIDGALIADYSRQPWKDDDRRWFETHPRRTHRRRPMSPGELPLKRLPDGTVAVVIVRQVEPGIRVKALCATPLDKPPSDHDEGLSILFDMIVERKRVGLQAISSHEVAAELSRRHPPGVA